MRYEAEEGEGGDGVRGGSLNAGAAALVAAEADLATMGVGAAPSKPATSERQFSVSFAAGAVTVPRAAAASSPAAAGGRKGRPSAPEPAVEQDDASLPLPGELRPDGLRDVKLAELSLLQSLGQGTFGLVRLVEHCSTGRMFALKVLAKGRVVMLRQTRNVMNEKEVMRRAQHPFILRLVSTMRDDANLYMLIELCLGGELFMLLHCSDNRPVEYVCDADACFYASCVLDVFEYLHAPERSILYRDLKVREPLAICLSHANHGHPLVPRSGGGSAHQHTHAHTNH
jgi:hypothetical protein